MDKPTSRTSRKILLLALLCLPIIVMVACGGGGDSDQPGLPENTENFTEPTETIRPMASAVEIDHPTDGTIIYAETLHVTGRVSETAQQFDLELVDIDGNVINTITVDSQPGEWERDFNHGYTGEPSEFTLRAVPTNPDDIVEMYTSTAILLSDVANRPEGIYGSITQPLNGAQVGGDMMLVSGRVSGASEVNVLVITDTGENLDSATTVVNPYLLDEVSWQAEITLGDYIGQATLQAMAINTDDEVEIGNIIISIGAAAG